MPQTQTYEVTASENQEVPGPGDVNPLPLHSGQVEFEIDGDPYNHPPDWGWIGMFRGFFDESTDEVQRIVYVVAGWIGPTAAWEYLNYCWTDILREFQLYEFH